MGFADQRFQNQENWNAMGPGIYFTALRDQARGYAGHGGWLYTAHVAGKCVTDHQRPSLPELTRFISMMNDEQRGYLFGNWDPDPRRALQMILRSYQGMDFVSAFADLGRQAGLDFGTEGRNWALALVNLGYAALVHRLPAVDHLVVWDPRAVQVVAEEHVP